MLMGFYVFKLINESTTSGDRLLLLSALILIAGGLILLLSFAQDFFYPGRGGLVAGPEGLTVRQHSRKHPFTVPWDWIAGFYWQLPTSEKENHVILVSLYDNDLYISSLRSKNQFGLAEVYYERYGTPMVIFPGTLRAEPQEVLDLLNKLLTALRRPKVSSQKAE